MLFRIVCAIFAVLFGIAFIEAGNYLALLGACAFGATALNGPPKFF